MTKFWSISYPLGCVANLLQSGKVSEAIKEVEKIIKDYSDAKHRWEEADKRYLDRAFGFEVYLAKRQGIELPTPNCLHLWIAHRSARELHGCRVLVYHALNKLLMELKDDELLQGRHIV